MKPFLLPLLLCLFCHASYCQLFHPDGSMVIKEVATDKRYGFDPDSKHAIKVGNISNEMAYLMALRGPNGEKLKWYRQGSCCEFKCKNCLFGLGVMEKYQVQCEGQEEVLILYLNANEFDDNIKAPAGFTIGRHP